MKVINLDDVKHGNRVASYSIEIAKQINYSRDKLENLYFSGMFHDIGKAYIDQTILNKPDKLTPEEKLIIDKHPEYSYKEVLKMGYPEDVAISILHHHENYNGSGYSDGLKGLEIPIESRILRIADMFDALTSDRPYRKKSNVSEAISIMDNEIDCFDPELYSIFRKCIFPKVKVFKPWSLNTPSTL